MTRPSHRLLFQVLFITEHLLLLFGSFCVLLRSYPCFAFLCLFLPPYMAPKYSKLKSMRDMHVWYHKIPLQFSPQNSFQYLIKHEMPKKGKQKVGRGMTKALHILYSYRHQRQLLAKSNKPPVLPVYKTLRTFVAEKDALWYWQLCHIRITYLKRLFFCAV